MITDVQYKNGKLKSGSGVAKAIHWTDIQAQMKELTWKQFKEVVVPVMEYFQEKEA
tara:strand:+ start:3858 stop:4025 length:168 start_codon:yes stop_codon:yes gene_type:complete